MFPPMNPHGERVRAELENQQLEWEAAFGANYGNAFVLEVFHRAIVDLFKRRPNLKLEAKPASPHRRRSASRLTTPGPAK